MLGIERHSSGTQCVKVCSCTDSLAYQDDDTVEVTLRVSKKTFEAKVVAVEGKKQPSGVEVSCRILSRAAELAARQGEVAVPPPRNQGRHWAQGK